MLDTGSQFSLINSKYVTNLKKDLTIKTVNTFQNISRIEGYDCLVNVTFPNASQRKCKFFACPDLSLRMSDVNLGGNIAHSRNSYIISPSFPEIIHNSITISGIIGNDLLHNFSACESITAGEGKMLRLANGLILLGHLNLLRNIYQHSG